MTPKNNPDPLDENSLGVLDDAASLDTSGIGILNATAQIRVTLPQNDDDDLEDDGVLDGEVIVDLIVDEEPLELVRPVEVAKTGIIAAIVPAREAEDESADAADGDADEDLGDAHDAPEHVDVDSDVRDDSEEGSDAAAAEAERAAEEEREAAAEAERASEAERAAEEERAAEAERAAEEERAAEAERAAEEERRAADEQAESDRVAAESAAAAQRAADQRAADQRAADQRAADQRAAEESAARNSIRAASSSTPVPRVPAPSEKENPLMSAPHDKPVVLPPTRASARTDVTLTSKRLGELSESGRESADLLTADRLLDPHRLSKPEPEGTWSHFLYSISGRRINIGDGRKARERKALSARIAAPLTGGARFVPVLSRKGGVGKTTITALLGMALADARDDRVIAVDANPDRGTLADRVVRPHHSKSVRDLVRIHDEVRGYHDISAIVARDATRLDVLASDPDPHIADAFSDSDYRDVAGVAAHYYSLVLTDTGTGIVHSVMSATLDLADQIVIVSGLSVDEARLASETLTWLESNGYEEQARAAIVVLNQSTPGAPLVRLNELEAHFATRAARVVRMPYDPQIAGGGTIVFAHLQAETRVAARSLAALLVEGLRAQDA